MIESGYVPFISRIHWSWTLLLSAVTCGAFPLLLGLYFAWWIHERRHAGAAIYFYSAIALTILAASILPFGSIQPALVEGFVGAGVIVWVTAGFILRNELRVHYGREFEISLPLTAIFSVYYINYCLWAIGDGV
jgi:hypothetical protein